MPRRGHARPVIRSVLLSRAGLVMSGGSGTAGTNFYLLETTNLATPLTNWVRLLTNQFDAAGNFSLTNPPYSNSSQSYYLLQVP